MTNEFKKMMVAGEKAAEPETVTVPVKPEYLTPEGMYVAGYWWGSQGRGTKWLPTDDPQFVMGVEDGNGDWLSSWKKQTEPSEDDHENVDEWLNTLDKLADAGILTQQEHTDLLYEAVKEKLDGLIDMPAARNPLKGSGY